MTTGSTAGKPGFSNAADATGPVAGYDKPLKKKHIKLPPGSRKRWMT